MKKSRHAKTVRKAEPLKKKPPIAKCSQDELLDLTDCFEILERQGSRLLVRLKTKNNGK